MRGRFPLLSIQFANTIGLRFLRRCLFRFGTAEPDAVFRCALFLFVAPAFFAELVQILRYPPFNCVLQTAIFNHYL